MTHQEAVDTLASERYLLDDMSDQDRQVFEEHFFSCHVCADDLRVAAAMLQGAKDGLAGSSTASHVVPMAVKPAATSNPRWHRSVALPWAVAATLAGVVAYQSLRVVPSQRPDLAPLALVPVTLRPASRGAEAVVPVTPRASLVGLALEINDAPEGGEIAYELTSADGRQIVSGRAAAPAPGTPLLLLIPSWTLVGPMHYILLVHDTQPSGRSLGEYRFAVSAQ